MSADQLRKKSRRAMKNKHTRQIRVCRFIVTSHAQNTLVERDIPTEVMIRNICNKPRAVGPKKPGPKGYSYERFNNESTTVINPDVKTVITIYPLKRCDARRYGIWDRIEIVPESTLRKERNRLTR